MNLSAISAGKDLPSDINVIIEVSSGSTPVKYEFDKDAGAVIVDRFLPVAMFYPANYGFIPHTLGGDGDPLDVLVITEYPIVPGSVIRCRPVAVLHMTDEGGVDEKIVAVPHDKLTPVYKDIRDESDLPEVLKQRIQHFFTSYKDLEPNKWVKIDRWGTKDEAEQAIRAGAAAA